MEDYEQTFRDFWENIVTFPDGTLNPDAVMRELHDYRTMLIEVPKVYDYVTGGIFTKPNTDAGYVKDAADEHYSLLHSDDDV